MSKTADAIFELAKAIESISETGDGGDAQKNSFAGLMHNSGYQVEATDRIAEAISELTATDVHQQSNNITGIMHEIGHIGKEFTRIADAMEKIADTYKKINE
jgi:methyl-accepting chemotaxis protein